MRILMLALALALTGLTSLQEPAVDELIKRLGSDDFAEQGKAAKELEQMGGRALAALQKVADDAGAKEQVRAWCRKIAEKIQAQDKRIQELIGKLGSDDPKIFEPAQAELEKIGRAAVPHLMEALKSKNEDLRRRAEQLLEDLGAGGELERTREEAGFAPVEPPRFKFRFQAKKESSASAAAVLSALKWLARHQNADGSWGAQSFASNCVEKKCRGAGDREYDAGVTGLALLAFLGAGHSHLSKTEHPDPLDPRRTLKFGEVVKNGLKWLLVKQDEEGCFGFRGVKYMYNHCIATLALIEAYGMTGSGLMQMGAKRGVEFIVAAQSDKAWRYVKKAGDNDTSVTGWALSAIKAADLAGLSPSTADVYRKALKWLNYVTDEKLQHRAGYLAPDSGKVFVPGQNETFSHHEAMTAVSIYGRLYMGREKDPALGGASLLMKDLPRWAANEIDFYYWYSGSLALFTLEGAEGANWKKWYEATKSAIIANQRPAKDGCAAGSWPSTEERWGFEGGPVYSTAINALTLETPYRYPRK